ncbi:MAG TPA: hypothetical protein DCS31_05905 [Candidatus Competibacteraceae bacterium]|nr:hypothetical protein [Candidatus Competibacteraceae bacterium]
MGKRILLVEDDDVARANYADLLADEGFEVEAVADRRSALARAKVSLPDIALLDVGSLSVHPPRSRINSSSASCNSPCTFKNRRGTANAAPRSAGEILFR